MQKKSLVAAALTLLSGCALLGLTGRHPAAHAAPTASQTKPLANPMAELLSGKLYPKTLKREALAPDYHYITLLDGQGKPAECATKGDMVQIAGETFLVGYLLFASPKSASPTDPAPPTPDAQLTLINLHYVQAMGGIRDTPTPAPVTTPPPATTPPALGTAAP